MRGFKTIISAGFLASALALAGCGGSNDGERTTDTTDMPDPAIEQRAAIDSAIAAASSAVAMVDDESTDAEVAAADAAIMAARNAIAAATDVPAAEKAANTRHVGDIAALLATSKASRTMAMNNEETEAEKARTAVGKALYAALAGNATADTNARDNATAALSAAGLLITPADGAGSIDSGTTLPARTLEAGDAAGSLSGWNGMDYADSSGTGASKVTHDARVYTNQGSGETVPFVDRGNVLQTESAGSVPTFTAIKGYLNVAAGGSASTGAVFARVMADAFTHSGTQNHAINSDTGIFTTRGTYDGAPGVYRCTGTCTSTNDGEGHPEGLGGTWHFKPDAGANAMAHAPDSQYLYYGWWVSKDGDGDPTAASAFAGRFGADSGDSTDGLDLGVAGSSITGSATYVGGAAGKWALNNAIEGTGDGGHFTADAELKATFGTGATAGVTGTIDEFRLNDGSENPGWSVELQRAGWDSGAATFGATTAGMTVWSINDIDASASGAWSGTMYDEMPGNAPGGDGSDVPTTATGTFYSAFGTAGRMVGAFGAER